MSEQLLYSIFSKIMIVFFIGMSATIAYYGVMMLVDEYKAKPDDDEKAKFAARCIIYTVVSLAIILVPVFTIRHIWANYDIPIFNEIHAWLNQF